MSRVRTWALASLLAGPLACNGAHAQARGPSAGEVLEKGQDVGATAREMAENIDQLVTQLGYSREALALGSMYWTQEDGFVMKLGVHTAALGKLGPPPPPPLDEESLASKNREHQAWLARLVGRFQLTGRLESRIEVGMGDPNNPAAIQYAYTTLVGKISGIADCAAVGSGAGVSCIFNATWPVVELDVVHIEGARPPSEEYAHFQPSVVVFGFNPDTAEIRASMVTDDSIAHIWAGRLEADTLVARRLNDCVASRDGLRRIPPPCFQPLEVIARPDGTVTMVHTVRGVTIRLEMQPDPAVQADKPMRTRKAR